MPAIRRLSLPAALLCGIAACAEPEPLGPPLPSGSELGASVSAALTAEGLLEDARVIVAQERSSGGPGEAAAIEHILARLDSAGVPSEVLEFDGLISTPDSARVEHVGSAFRPYAITPSFSVATDSLTGSLVDVGALDDLPRPETGTGELVFPAPYDTTGPLGRVRGRIALVTGQPRGVPTRMLQSLGAVGVIFVAPEERLNDLIVTTTWGNPSLQNVHRLPRIPVVEVRRSDGDSLRALLAREPDTQVRLSTWLRTRWTTLRLPVAHIVPERDADAPFVLFGGHIDAWHQGATDEGASNAAMLALALEFHARRAELRRGLRVAWWPGHSTGRYSGSTWYADSHFMELRDHALAYVNVDGIGQMGATDLRATTTASLAPLAVTTLGSLAGQQVDPGRPGRDSDQSFNGVALPLLQLNRTRPASEGGYWWWHTPEDTFDKIGPDVLLEDTRLYAATLATLLNAPLYPVDLIAQMDEFRRALELRSAASTGRLELEGSAARLERLRERAGEIAQRLTAASADPAVDLALVRILRPLHQVLYVPGSVHHPDPGISDGPLPGLAPARVLAEAAPESGRYHAAQTSLLRERNRIDAALEEAWVEAGRLLETLPAPR